MSNVGAKVGRIARRVFLDTEPARRFTAVAVAAVLFCVLLATTGGQWPAWAYVIAALVIGTGPLTWYALSNRDE